jgi:arsenical pump membrane protein
VTAPDRYTVWALAGMATIAVMFRPWRLPEWVWPVTAASLLVITGVLSPAEARSGVRDGTDVYLFLAGMMLLAELARKEGLFDWLAEESAHFARGSAVRLFVLIYVVGVVVTVFLSNDATAVVLTPAVIAMTRAAQVRNPMPHLLICALVANAASFVLPISNPANLVIYGSRIPSLWEWLELFSLPSAIAIVTTLVLLYWMQRAHLRAPLAPQKRAVPLPAGARVTAIGLMLTALALMLASARSLPLGLATLICALATFALVTLCTRRLRWDIASGLSWGVFPLVAGLFVLVRALDATGAIESLRTALDGADAAAPRGLTLLGTAGVALICNIANNLPIALLAGRVLDAAHPSGGIPAATLIAVDIGPNLSVTGSLATLLWLQALRREGMELRARDFLRLGAVVMPPALILALVAALRHP